MRISLPNVMTLLAAVALLRPAPPAAAAEATLVCPATVQAGQQFVGEVKIDVGATALGAYSVQLMYDPVVVTVASVAGGATTEFSATPTANSPTPGTTNIAAFQTSSLDSPTGVVSVAKVTFDVAATASPTASVGLTVNHLYDTSAAPIVPATGTGCTVSVIGGTTTTTTTTTQAPTTTTTSITTTTTQASTTTTHAPTTTTTVTTSTTTTTSSSTTTQAPTTTTTSTTTTTTKTSTTTTSTTSTTTTQPTTTTTTHAPTTTTTSTTIPTTTTTKTTTTTTTTQAPTTTTTHAPTTTTTTTTTTTHAPTTTTTTSSTTTTTTKTTTTTTTTRASTTTTTSSSTSTTTTKTTSTTTTTSSTTTTTTSTTATTTKTTTTTTTTQGPTTTTQVPTTTTSTTPAPTTTTVTTSTTTTTTVPTGELPNCSAAVAAPATLFPANHKFVPVSIDGLVAGSQDNGPLITITGVTQDEPVGSCPDAAGIGTDTALLRASRQPGGDGRVYHVSFVAEDSAGGVCTGTVSVCVPRKRRTACVDQGPLSDSTVMTCGLPCADACGIELQVGSLCPNERVPLPISRDVARAQILLQRAAHDSIDARKEAHIAAATRALKQGAQAASRARRKKTISDACAASIQTALAHARRLLR